MVSRGRTPGLVLFSALLLAEIIYGSEYVNAKEPNIIHKLPTVIGDKLTISQVTVFGQAKTTSWKLLSGTAEAKNRTYIVIFGKNDDILAGLYNFINETKLDSASFTALGAVGSAALGFYRPEDHTYTVTKIEKQAELASLVGNIGMKNGKAVVHTHGVFSMEDGSCRGGHIFYASVWPTVEMTVTENQTAPIRHEDDESGLWLYDSKAQ